MKLTLVTGNAHKLAEWQRLSAGRFELVAHKIDLDEMQSLDAREIVRHKLHQAYKQLQTPVVVEDVAAGLDDLGGLPGPFIKWFNEVLGKDALYKLAGHEAAATVRAVAGYYDGIREIFGTGKVHGKVVPARGGEAFGFDSVFVPDGQDLTYSQMERAQKDNLSHRRLSIDDLLSQLEKL